MLECQEVSKKDLLIMVGVIFEDFGDIVWVLRWLVVGKSYRLKIWGVPR